MAQRSIFVASSTEARNSGATAAVVEGLERNLGHEFTVVPWWSTEWENLKSALNTLQHAIRRFDFAVFLCWPDDLSTIRKKRVYQTRDNVIFEFGLFLPVLDTKRTFALVPSMAGSNRVFHFLSDIGPSLYVHPFICRVDAGRTPVHDSSSLISSIDSISVNIKRFVERSDHERRSRLVAKDQLVTKLREYRAIIDRLSSSNASETHLLQAAGELIPDLIRLKAAASDRTIIDSCRDIGIYIELVDDLLNIEQLAAKQKFNKSDNPIREVWVFGFAPLEFVGGASGDARIQLPELHKTIAHNISSNVIYKYFVSDEFETSRIANFFAQHGIDMALMRNVQVIRLEGKLFKTFYTVHLYDGNEHDVYMSAIMHTRNDLMIKLSPEQSSRVVSILQKTIGFDCIEDNVSVRTFLLK